MLLDLHFEDMGPTPWPPSAAGRAAASMEWVTPVSATVASSVPTVDEYLSERALRR